MEDFYLLNKLKKSSLKQLKRKKNLRILLVKIMHRLVIKMNLLV